MATLNFAHRELTVKVVYSGPPKAGCNSSVRALYRDARFNSCSRLLQFGSRAQTELSHFFEFEAPGVQIVPEFSLWVQVYSLPGGVSHPAHRREVLKDADAIIYLADARPENSRHNLEYLLELEKTLEDAGRPLDHFPIVFQLNHVDSPEAMSLDRAMADLNPRGAPVFETQALEGVGIQEALLALLEEMEQQLQATLSGAPSSLSVFGHSDATRLTVEQIVSDHLDIINTTGASEEQLRTLDRSEVLNIAFQTEELIGFRAAHLLQTEITPDGIKLDLILSRISGQDTQRVEINLLNQPQQLDVVTRPLKATHRTATHSDFSPLAAQTLPPNLFPLRFMFGLIGLCGGAIAGLLLGFLFFG